VGQSARLDSWQCCKLPKRRVSRVPQILRGKRSAQPPGAAWRDWRGAPVLRRAAAGRGIGRGANERGRTVSFRRSCVRRPPPPLRMGTRLADVGGAAAPTDLAQFSAPKTFPAKRRNSFSIYARWACTFVRKWARAVAALSRTMDIRLPCGPAGNPDRPEKRAEMGVHPVDIWWKRGGGTATIE
jgi:hypothetical protein